jgi:hypothetical protein
MTMNQSIFGLRFGSNVSLQPTQEELRMFLETRKEEGGRELHGSVLATYNEVLDDVLSFRSGRLPDAPPRDEHEKLFYGALSHSFFFDQALKSAVEQYKYQLHVLSTIDLKKPRAFINAAEQEISLLNPGRKADAARMIKMQGLVDDRKKVLETINRRWPALVQEIGYLALYIRDNLFAVANRCETSIAVLVGISISRMKEKQLIEDVRVYLKEQFEYGLYDGIAAGQRFKNVQNDFALLSTELSNIFRESIFALTQLYESIYDHTLKAAREIDALMGERRKTMNRSIAGEAEFFTRIEKVLDALISGERFELKKVETKNETSHKDIFLEKRKEMLDHLFQLMQKDRRAWLRRSREQRRASDDRKYQNPSRRSGADRRAGKDRRRALSLSA